MKSIKTPADSFKNIKDFPFTEHYVSFQDLDMHYVDEEKGEEIAAYVDTFMKGGLKV